MLISEIKGWQWLITWDNPVPPNSSAMLRDLQSLGRVKTMQTKTTVFFAPRAGVAWHNVRAAIGKNLHPAIGNAAYVNLRSRMAFQLGAGTNFKWKRVV